MKIDFHCRSKNITREELLMNAIATTVAQQSADQNRGRELELMMTPRVRQVVAQNQQDSDDKQRRELLCKGAVLIKHAYNDSRLREPKWFQVTADKGELKWGNMYVFRNVAVFLSLSLSLCLP